MTQLRDMKSLWTLVIAMNLAFSGRSHPDELLPNVVLQKPRKALQGPAKQCQEVLGQFQATLAHRHKTSTQMLYVVQGLKTNLLGLPAITSLNLLCRMDTVACDLDVIHARYPTLFKGLGTLGEDYTIKVKDDATPYALCTPRNVAISLREKVKVEIHRMESNGVISKVTTPTPWCAGPKVDDTLAQLAGATIFSKIDANSGFWQIPLAEASRPLTTFITPYGRYLFNKLLFGSRVPQNCFSLE